MSYPGLNKFISYL